MIGKHDFGEVIPRDESEQQTTCLLTPLTLPAGPGFNTEPDMNGKYVVIIIIR